MNAADRQRISDAVEAHPWPGVELCGVDGCQRGARARLEDEHGGQHYRCSQHYAGTAAAIEDDADGHPFSLDVPASVEELVARWDAPTHEVVAIVSAPASLAERLAAVERVRVLVRELTRHANHWGRNDHTSNARALADSHAAAYDAIDALAGITPADRARSEGR